MVYTPDLLTAAVFRRMFVDSYCLRAFECDAECEVPITLPDPEPRDPPTCVFDVAAGRECLKTRETWACDDAVGVRLPDACQDACR